MIQGRRPLRSRETRWATKLTRGLLKVGFRPNQISILSVVFAVGGSVSLFLVPHFPNLSPLLWILGAAGIQLRLLCNLMDGLLAVEGGLRTPDGDLYNEFPDRLSDPLLLVALGWAGGEETTRLLGWLCGTGALLTAAIRLHGASLTGSHDFRGPMAKPQRMAVATVSCLVMAALAVFHLHLPVLTWILGILFAGVVVTVIRRLSALSRALRASD